MSEVDIVGGFATFVAASRAGGFRAPDDGSSAEQVAADVVQHPLTDGQLLALRG